MKKTLFIVFSLMTINISAQQVKNYYPNGELFRVGYLDSNKNPTGEWEFYNKNGLLEKTGTVKNRMAVGKWKFYSKTGMLEYTGSFNEKLSYWDGRMGMDKPDKDHSFSHSIRAINFTFGRKTGEWKYFDKDELLTRITTYSNGRKDGIQKKYHYKQLIEEGMYKNGIEIGAWKAYYNSGELHRIMTYTCVRYVRQCSRDTNPLKIISGVEKWYSKNGKLIKIKKY